MTDGFAYPTRNPAPRTALDCALLNGVEPEMPKPADLAALGLRPPDYFTVTRSLSTLMAAAAARSPPSRSFWVYASIEVRSCRVLAEWRQVSDTAVSLCGLLFAVRVRLTGFGRL
jgi:hypothetical protein